MRDPKYTYRISWRHFLILPILSPLTNSTCIHINVYSWVKEKRQAHTPAYSLFTLAFSSVVPTKLPLKMQKQLSQLCLGPHGYRGSLAQAVPQSNTVGLLDAASFVGILTSTS